MSEYKKALSILYGNSLIEAGKPSKEWITYAMAIEHNEPIVKANDLLKEAIEKAEKYDGIVEAEEKFLATVKGEKKMSKGIEFYLKLVKERDEAYEELSEKQIEYDKLFDEATKIRQERDEANKRIEELEKVLEEFKVNNGVELCDLLNDLKTQNKVLVDGVKAIKENSLLWFEDDNLLVGREFDHEYQLDKYDLNEEDDYNKIKAMLEVVENE